MPNWVDVDVVCPFFRRNDPNRIRCEGVENRNTINLVFEDTKQQEAYLHRFCCDIKQYKRCLICEALNRKYGGCGG
jgi:hypothetical protein